jgi:hypothetical protein
MQKNFKLNQKGLAGIDVMAVSMLLVMILMIIFVFAFEFYMFFIRLNQASSALISAGERLQTELSTESASGAKAVLSTQIEDLLALEIEHQLNGEARVIELHWLEEGTCPLGNSRDDPMLHLVVAFHHEPSFLVSRLMSLLGHSVSEFRIHLDREIEMDI